MSLVYLQSCVDTMANEDNDFFKQLGGRVAQFRKEQHLTQTELAEILSISQQHMASFEAGARKIPASMLPILAKQFAVTTDELLGVTPDPSKRGPVSKLYRQVELISALPRTKQKLVVDILDAVIQQQQMAG